MATDTKNSLLESAERAARARGFDGFSYADLAKEVGIRKASIHHHFPSKAALSVALMKRYYSNIESVCSNIDATEATAAKKLTRLIDQYRAALSGGKSLCLCVSFSTSRESLPPEVIEQISRFRAMMIGWLERVFKTGQTDGSIKGISTPSMEAAATLPLLEGAQLAARAEENPELFERSLGLLSLRIAKPF
ncbi:MAG: TetR/AcrR family transcriptional regulator [Paracoccaceae bacterium]